MTKTTVTLALAAFALAAPAFAAETVYDNATGLQNLMTRDGHREVGDQITLSGSDMLVMDRFEFESNFIRGTGDGVATAQIRFYALRDVPVAGGGTAQYPEADAFQVSPVFDLSEGLQRHTWGGVGGTPGNRPPLGFTVPQTFVWTVTFNGFDTGSTEEAGLLFYGEPEIGSSANDYWRRDNNFAGWELFDTPGFEDSFGARVVTIPEPTTLALIGGAALMMGLRRRKA